MMQARKILVVDDEPRIVDIIAEYLTLKGFDVEKAYGGRECLDALEQTPSIDLIILDKKMPGVDGIAVMRHLKKTGSDIPVIVVTGSINLSGLLHTKEIGYEYILPKPVRLAKLFETIKAVLTRK
jgi:two-component system OmpR family response regulator